MTLHERRSIIADFNAAVDEAIAGQPPSREWVRRAIRRGGAPRCPVRLRRLSLDIILRHGRLLTDLFRQYPDDAVVTWPYDAFVGYQRPGIANPIDTVQVLTESAQWMDEWGTTWGHAADGVGASTIAYPLEDWSDFDNYLARLPQADEPGRLDGSLPAVRRHRPTRYTAGASQLALFERLHCLRGMEQTFEDLCTAPAQLERLLDALTEYLVVLIDRWGALGVDGWFLTDDWGTQQSLMVSPDMWRRFFAGRYRRLCERAHRWNMDVIFHSCGNVTGIVKDLIDVGVDVLDPLQPEAMDLNRIAREFGGKLSFKGGISDQELVTFTPQQVRDHVRRTIDTLGGASQNAYVVSPSNMLPPDVPAENLVALFQACHA